MGCERYEDDLSDAAAGAEPSAALTSHLRDCGSCRARLEEARRLLADVDRVVEAALEIEPSAPFVSRLRARIAEEKEPRAPVPRWIPALAAGLAAVALLGWLLARRERGPSPTPRVASQASPVVPALPGPEASAPTGDVEQLAQTSTPDVPTVGTVARPRPEESRPARRHAANGTPRRRAARPPEVLVQPGQEEAIAELMAGLWSHSVEPETLLTVDRSVETSLPELDPVTIPPLEITPISVDSEGRSDS